MKYGARNKITATSLFIYRTSLFERCLESLRKKSGTAATAAKRIDEFINNLTRPEGRPGREQFRFTWNGEYRIRNCKKIDLTCGYRLVCIKKDSRLVFLYAGSHDDCFRWIERNKGLNFELDNKDNAIEAVREVASEYEDLPDDLLEQRRFVEAYEKALMRRLDDRVMSEIFCGFCKGGSERAVGQPHEKRR